MSAIRLQLLCAFAGGCLSNAVLFGLWRAADSAGGSAVKQQHRSQNVVELVTAASAAPSVGQPSELSAASAADRGHDPATEAPPTPVASDTDGSGPTPAGSAVSDVLTRLETAYRERVAARAPAQAASTQERTSATAPADSAVAAAEAAPAVPAQPVAEVIPAAAPAPPVAAVPSLPPPVAALPSLPPPVAAAPAFAPEAPAMPALAAQDIPPPPPSQIQYGDVNQNTYITNIREGDTYLIQMQQVAMLQYLQLLGSSSGLVAPTRHGGAGHQRGAFSTGITNPDNPWGFHFAPPNLVR